MPAENRFQHQLYPSSPSIVPVRRLLKATDGREFDFSPMHNVLNVGRVILVHGTFMGDDSFGIADTLKAVADSVPLLAGQLNRLADSARTKTRPLANVLAGDIGNYTESYRDRFQELVGDDPQIELFTPTWSGQNHHLARADLAVRLLHQLLTRPLLPDQNVVLWGHSHAGNAFALLTNLLANHKPAVEKFFEAANQSGQPHWDDVKQYLASAPSPHSLAKHVMIVGFETPVRYGWDTNGCLKLVHVTFHRPYDDDSPEKAKPLFPPWMINDVINAKWGDWVQTFAIAGTDVSTMPAQTINANLTAFLEANLPEPQHGLDTRFISPKRVRDACFRWKSGTRCHGDGINLLVDYEPSGDLTSLGTPIETSAFGHGVATTLRWLPTHLELVLNALLQNNA